VVGPRCRFHDAASLRSNEHRFLTERSTTCSSEPGERRNAKQTPRFVPSVRDHPLCRCGHAQWRVPQFWFSPSASYRHWNRNFCLNCCFYLGVFRAPEFTKQLVRLKARSSMGAALSSRPARKHRHQLSFGVRCRSRPEIYRRCSRVRLAATPTTVRTSRLGVAAFPWRQGGKMARVFTSGQTEAATSILIQIAKPSPG
jgi:hypothetical protein